jgi:hypothetical protein
MLTEVSCRRQVVSTELCAKLWVREFNLLNPSGYFTCHQGDIQKFYMMLTLCDVCVL